MQTKPEHDCSAQRFHLRVEAQLCVLDYQLSGRVMTIVHTGVPEAVAGRGIAALLTATAVAAARELGWQVRPACSYAARWFERHPEQADLLA